MEKRYIIHGYFQSIMDLAQALEAVPRKYGTSSILSHAEIHMIEIIGDNENSSVTDIASLLNITKGAVSQALKRLESKGITSKKKDPENLSRSIVMLTAKGKTAYWAHKHWHEKLDGGFSEYFETLEDEKADIIIDFLDRVRDFLYRRVHSDE
jgi:DNA-binding MarR family transcriptional regulator